MKQKHCLIKMHFMFIFQPVQVSVVKRQEGVLLVELFESEGPSLNVQLLQTGGVELDESLRPVMCYSASMGSGSSGLSQNQTSSNLLVTSNHQSFQYICCAYFLSLLLVTEDEVNKTNIHYSYYS